MTGKGYRIAIVGATGAVGREMIAILENRPFPISVCVPFASPRSRGKPITLRGRTYACHVLEKGCFQGIDFAFFDASDEVSREWVPEALAAGAWVIDNSGVHRMDSGTELSVPEVNGDRLDQLAARGPQAKKLVAGPNCTTVQLVTALKPLLDRYGLKRVCVSTYQSVSGAGTAAMDELQSQLRSVLAGGKAEARVLKHPIAFNLIPQIGSFDADGHTSEEKKVIQETRKILGLPELAISCTAVRVPTLACHAESVNVELAKDFELSDIRDAFSNAPGVRVEDEPSQFRYPMNRDGAGQDPVYVGRIRRDPSHSHGLQFWVVADNLRKGAALNAIQIAERIVARLQ